MNTTRFMDRMFSATAEGDEELTQQVANDVESAKENGSVETDEVTYVNLGQGKVAVTDLGNGEVTIIERADDGNYDLYPAEQSEQIEGYIHPEGDGVTPGQQEGAPDEDVKDHMTAEDGTCPECGKNPCECGDEREFSVYTDNTIVQRIFCDQEFCERIFSEVIESEDTAKVGDLKIEKDPDEENAVVVTDETTGDQAKVVLEDDEMEVTELDSKNFSEEEQFDALHVVGVDTFNHQIIDAEEWDEESAQDLVERLQEVGVDAVEVFDNPEDARDYAISLLENLGVESEEDIDEPEQAEFSEHEIFVTRYFSNNTVYMDRLFSEACNDVEASQSEIEDAIEEGDEVETDNEVITPIDAKTAVIEDKENGEYTKVTLDGDEMNCESISEDEAKELMDHVEVEDEDDENEDEEEKSYSNIYSDETETRFFSENELMSEYMVRLFSGEADESAIEDAIENGDEVETDNEVITPIDAKTAVIEDKENGEFSKATLSDDDIDIVPISEDEADELTKDLEVEDTDEDKDEDEEEKSYSTLDKFFADIQQGAAQDEPEVIPAVMDPQSGQLVPVDSLQQGQEAKNGVPSVEVIEDKALAAVQSIQAAANEAQAAILNAKAAPATEDPELQEAQFSDFEYIDDYADEKTFSESEDTLVSWLINKH